MTLQGGQFENWSPRVTDMGNVYQSEERLEILVLTVPREILELLVVSSVRECRGPIDIKGIGMVHGRISTTY